MRLGPFQAAFSKLRWWGGCALPPLLAAGRCTGESSLGGPGSLHPARLAWGFRMFCSFALCAQELRGPPGSGRAEPPLGRREQPWSWVSWCLKPRKEKGRVMPCSWWQMGWLPPAASQRWSCFLPCLSHGGPACPFPSGDPAAGVACFGGFVPPPSSPPPGGTCRPSEWDGTPELRWEALVRLKSCL